MATTTTGTCRPGLQVLPRCRLAGWLALACLGTAAATSPAAPGDLDPGFGNAGEYLRANARGQLVMLPSGQLLETAIVRDGAGIALKSRRLLADGRPDPAWGAGGEATVDLSRLPFRNEAWTSAYWLARPQRDGTILVQVWLGTDARSSIGGLAAQPLDLVLRLRADGALDTRYGTEGMTLLQDGNRDWIFGVIPQADGSTLVVEGCNICDVYPSADRIRRLGPDGREDRGFTYRGETLEVVLGSVFTAVRRPDGVVLVAGSGGLMRINADGAVDTSGGAKGRIDLEEGLTARLRDVTRRADLSPTIAGAALDRDGRIVLALAVRGVVSAGSGVVQAIAIARLDRDGAIDPSFGSGAGLGVLSFAGAPWAAQPFSFQFMTVAVADDGGVTVHAQLSLDDATALPGRTIGLARFDAAGRPRTPVPDGGLQLLGHGGAPWLEAVGPADTVILGTARGAVRLRGDAGDSPGMLSFGDVRVQETAGLLRIPLVRAAGSRGAVALEYTTADEVTGSAPLTTAGSDYVATTGRVEWADGESGLKYASIPLIDDAAAEPTETLTVRLRALSGAAILNGSELRAYIQSDEVAPAPAPPRASAPAAPVAAGTPPPSTPANSGSGGGGSVDPRLLPALLLYAFRRRRGDRSIFRDEK
jgi:uncharacterized delta-60 repeat protein